MICVFVFLTQDLDPKILEWHNYFRNRKIKSEKLFNSVQLLSMDTRQDLACSSTRHIPSSSMSLTRPPPTILCGASGLGTSLVLKQAEKRADFRLGLEFAIMTFLGN